jgi:hypothetical protein
VQMYFNHICLNRPKEITFGPFGLTFGPNITPFTFGPLGHLYDKNDDSLGLFILFMQRLILLNF